MKILAMLSVPCPIALNLQWGCVKTEISEMDVVGIIDLNDFIGKSCDVFRKATGVA